MGLKAYTPPPPPPHPRARPAARVKTTHTHKARAATASQTPTLGRCAPALTQWVRAGAYSLWGYGMVVNA